MARKKTLIRQLIEKAIKETEVSAGPENTKFTLRTGVNKNPTKLGIKVQFTPVEGMLEPDVKSQLEVALQEKLNTKLAEYDIQVSKDTDVPREDVIGFFIPLSQIKNLIVTGITGQTPEKPTVPAPGPEGNERPTPPSRPTPPTTPEDEDEDEELSEQEAPLDRAARLAKEPLGGGMDKWKTGLSLKQSGYADEQGGKLPLKELYSAVSTIKDLMLKVWVDVVNESDYKFKDNLEKNEDQYTRVGAIMSILADELEDRLELEEPVGPDQGIEERFKNVIKKLVKEQTKQPLNEVQMKVRELNEISKIVNKDDFYEFINKGNNILRTLEENGNTNGKKYLEYLVKNNIM